MVPGTDQADGEAASGGLIAAAKTRAELQALRRQVSPAQGDR
jgi:hypothetical protein